MSSVFDIMHDRANRRGGSIKQDMINESRWQHEWLGKDDPSSTNITLYDRTLKMITNFKGNIVDDKSQQQYKGIKKAIFDIGMNVDIGDYLRFGNQSDTMDYWIVEYVEDNNIYKTAMITQCNYLLKWVSRVNYKVVEFPVPIIHKNSYSSGVWHNAFAQYVDGEISCMIPLNDETMRIRRDDRFLVTNNILYPDAYRISRTENALYDGLIILSFIETEPSKVFDDFNEFVADRWLFEAEFNIEGKEKMKISYGETIKLKPKLYANTRKGLDRQIVPNVEYRYSSDDEYAKVTEGGVIEGVKKGETLILIEAYLGDFKASEFVVELTVGEEEIKTPQVILDGNRQMHMSHIFNYEITTVLQNEILDDSYTVDITTDKGSTDKYLDFELNDNILTITTFSRRCNVIITVNSLRHHLEPVQFEIPITNLL